MNEPLPVALFLTTLGVLLAICVLFARFAGRVGVPLALGFLLIGMLAGSEGIGGIQFEDYSLAFRLGSVALVVILFDGGLNTRLSSVREVLAPAAVLATVGVVITAAAVAVGARLLGLSWEAGCLLGAIVSSTDAAAVFAILRGAGVRLRRRVAATVEAESGLNDPMAVLLTMAVTAHLAGEREGAGSLLLGIAAQLAIGTASGVGIGLLARWMLRRISVPAAGLLPALTLAVAMLAFGLPTLAGGSGFLSVYIAAVILGNGPLPYRAGILRVFDAGAWFSQIGMFLLLGLLVFPSRLAAVALTGVAVAGILSLVARPAAVALCLLPFGFARREIAFVAWAGLRGAVPIVLATLPVLSGLPMAKDVFDIVFFVVVVAAIVPGATMGWAARRLGMRSEGPPPPSAVLEVSSLRNLNGEVLSFTVTAPSAVAGMPLRDIPFPEGAAVMLVVRGDDLVAARGGTVLEPGDHVHVFLRPEDRPFVQLLFGRPEGE